MSVAALWLPRDPRGQDAAAVQRLATELGCPAVVAGILVSRGIEDRKAADLFLHPTVEGWLRDPACWPEQMLGMSAAVDRILGALRAGLPILIYGDYDVDGTTATVLLKTTLERIARALQPATAADIRYHVPHRLLEGYGMQRSVLARAAQSGVRLVISVDTGIRAFAEAVEARALGLDLIVTDHHLPDDYQMPDCLAVVNPAQPGCPYPNKELCGAAVAFKLAHALFSAAAPGTADPDAFRSNVERVLIPSFLKLVAIATVADAVPLRGENRAIAAMGLAALANPVQPGLRALMDVARLPLDQAPTATEVAFRLAPRINAAGRMDVASEVVELLLTRNRERAQLLAEKLDALNRERRESEARALVTIEERLRGMLTEGGEYPGECLILDHPEWHRGVLGILASRVVERTHRPALVITHADGDAHGSGRSIPGFHLLDALVSAETASTPERLFHRFGGHAHAVGFSLASGRLDELRARISEHAAGQLTPEVLRPRVRYDAELRLEDVDPTLYGWAQKLAPFGQGNPEPVFLVRGAVIASSPRTIKGRHICLELAGMRGAAGENGQRLEAAISAVGWSRGGSESAEDRASWTARCEALNLQAGSDVDLLVRLRRKTGRYANAALGGMELEIEDLRRGSGGIEDAARLENRALLSR